ncbi:DUF84 family protein [Candidatus Dojkabacteria bacterium]|nr:DUF84 family protein [Candidatus Dojkabacteria bacterium]
MRITICGSISFYKTIRKVEQRLNKLGFETFIPVGFGKTSQDDEKIKDSLTLEEDAQRKINLDLINEHHRKVQESEGIFIVNLDKNGMKNYIGGNTFLEMGFAFVNNRDIFLYNPIPSNSYTAEIKAMRPMIINKNLNKVVKYYKNLPKVYVSSKSTIKINSVSFGLRQSGFKANVLGVQTKSSVSNQPLSYNEIYEGAINRLKNLKEQSKGKYEYLVSIESGLVFIDKGIEYIDLGLCIIEDKKGRQELALSAGIRIPSVIAKKIIETKDELGPYFQRKYNLKEKDAALYLSHGKVKREDLLKQAVACAYSNIN